MKHSSHNSLFSFHVNRLITVYNIKVSPARLHWKMHRELGDPQHFARVILPLPHKRSHLGKFLKVPNDSTAGDLYAMTPLHAAQRDGSSFMLQPWNTIKPLDLQERCQHGSEVTLQRRRKKGSWAIKDYTHSLELLIQFLLIPEIKCI